jgi:hypothetical protein
VVLLNNDELEIEMKPAVTVRHFGLESPVAQTLDDHIGITHARHGMPVAVRIERGNNASTFHLTFREATELFDALNALRKGGRKS